MSANHNMSGCASAAPVRLIPSKPLLKILLAADLLVTMTEPANVGVIFQLSVLSIGERGCVNTSDDSRRHTCCHQAQRHSIHPSVLDSH